MRVRIAAMMVGWALLAFCPSPAQADPITIVQDNRFVMSDAFAFNDLGFAGDFSREQHQGTDARDAVAEASFGNTASRADSHLVSAISSDAGRFSGTGTADAFVRGPNGLAQASSRFELLFNLTEGRAFDFSATFDALSGSWQAHLIESPGDFERQALRFNFSSNTGLPDEVSSRGFLNPGRYEFAIRADAAADTRIGNFPNGRSAFEFAFDTNPVPEPASLLLISSGVVGLIGRTRRRTRRASLDSPPGN